MTGEGQDAVPTEHEPAARNPAAPAQPGAAGLVRPLPARGVAIAFGYLRAFTWRQVIGWLRRKHPGITWKDLRRRYCGGGWWPADGEVILFNPGAVQTTRYRYRGTKIPSPWPSTA